MGQFLVVQGGAPDASRALYERGLAAFAAIHGARPEASAAAGPATFVAKFARRCVAAPGLARDSESGDVGLSAGTFVAEGRSDAAVLRSLRSVLLDGGTPLSDAQRRLDGYFVLLAARGSDGEVRILTDRVGGLHAYEAQHEGCTLLSTSSLVLAAVLRAPLDPVSVRELLGAASVFEERSLFAGVRKLPAASILRWERGSPVARQRWWNLGDVSFGRAPAESSARDLAAAVIAAQRDLLGAFERPILDLTGGFDSRNLLAAALRSGHGFATVVNGQAGDPDVVVAGRIAAALGLDHRHQQPGRDFPEPSFAHFQSACALGDGEANVFDYAPTMLVQTRTSEGFDLAVNGSFGELCRGYWWDLLGLRLWSRSAFDAQRFAAGRFANDGGWAESITPGLGAPPLLAHFTGAVERTVSDLAGMPDVAKADAVYVRMRMQRWGGRIVSLTSRLRPCAAPFMFAGPLGAALSMPPASRAFGRGARSLIASLDPRLAAMATDSGAPAGPIRPWNAHRFLPLAGQLAGKAWGRVRRKFGGGNAQASASTTWRAGDVWRLPEMNDLLRPESMKTRDLYDGARLATFLDSCRSGRVSPSATLGRIVTLELAARAAGS